jgi:hypothetical protein
LVGERAQAQVCVSLLKGYGTSQQTASGKFAYAIAKSDSDAAIAGLITALATRDTLGGLPNLQAKIASSGSGLADFCRSVREIVSTTTDGERGLASALIKAIDISSLMNGVLAGVAALYNNYNTEHALTRKIIQTQLEGAKWPDFDEVKPER